MQSHKFALRFTTGLLLSAMLVTPALALQGTVNTDGGMLNVRSAIGTDSDVLTKIADNTKIEILDAFPVPGENYNWYEVSCNGVKGFVSGEFVDLPGQPAPAAVKEDSARYVKITTGSLNVRTGPGTNYDKAGKLSGGSVVKVLGESDGWLQIENGYISAEFTAPSSAAEVPSSKGQQIVDYAMGFLGSRYVYGGSSPSGFDCSGFTKYVYKHFGYDLNRSASDQLRNGVSVPRSELQPGDLVMFRKSGSKKRASHVGLYIGGNQFIHASTSKVGVIISDMNSSYYKSGFVDARRIIK